MFPKPSPESPPMFESAFIDRFSRTPWFMVPILHIPLLAAAFGYAVLQTPVTWLEGALLFGAGWLVWTLTEYWAHRTLFHWVPPGKFGERMHFILHGVHHDYPRDRYRLVFPPALSLSLAVPFFFLFISVFASRGYALYAGFAAGYVFYDVMHYYLHHGRAQSGWVKKLRKHHLVHHSPRQGSESKFGVSTTLWDHVFRTL